MTRSRTRHRLLGFVPFGLAALGAAVIGGLASGDAGQTYQQLALPAFAPPAWLFGPAWTVLYVLVALAGWRAWTRSTPGDRTGLVLWGVQMGLNALWTPLFFGAGLYWAAFAEICVLWLATAATLALFARRSRSRTAAWLMTPYLGWITFAGALNAAIAAAN